MRRTAIEWADYSCNPIRATNHPDEMPLRTGWACVRVSAGCANCYAATLNRRLGTGLDYTVPAMSMARQYLDERVVMDMLRFRPRGPFKNGRGRPAVFVGDMTDLFGEWVPAAWLDDLFEVFDWRGDVDWLLLTKRPQRVREYLSWRWRDRPNVWLGVSVEDQETADQRIPELLATPAAVRFLSCEPLLAPLDLEPHLHDSDCWGLTLADRGEGDTECTGANYQCICNEPREDHISWVIVGGESGTGARPCDLAWIRSIVAQCRAADVPVFVKQLGARPMYSLNDQSAFREGLQLGDGNGGSFRRDSDGRRLGLACRLKDRKGGDPNEWPEDLRVRAMPR